MSWPGCKSETKQSLKWSFGESFIREAFLEEVALEVQLVREEPRLTAFQEGQAPKDVLADGAPLLTMALTSTCPLASFSGFTVDW